jgi:hypothetical protein
LTLLFI